MGKVTKLRGNDVDRILEEAAALGLTEVMVVGKTADGDVISYISDNTTAETLACGALLVQHEATQLLID